VASWENQLFKRRYKNKVLHLLEELERAPVADVTLEVQGDAVKLNIQYVPQLVHRIKRKELDVKGLAKYSPDVLWPDGPFARAMLALRERDLAIERAKAVEKDYEGLFKCRRCKSTKTTYYQMQTRSADEPMVRSLLILLFFLLQKTDAVPRPYYRLRTSRARTADTSGSADLQRLLARRRFRVNLYKNI